MNNAYCLTAGVPITYKSTQSYPKGHSLGNLKSIIPNLNSQSTQYVVIKVTHIKLNEGSHMVSIMS